MSIAGSVAEQVMLLENIGTSLLVSKDQVVQLRKYKRKTCSSFASPGFALKLMSSAYVLPFILSAFWPTSIDGGGRGDSQH